jgi:hypothetical protein
MTTEVEHDEPAICAWCDKEFTGEAFGLAVSEDYCSEECEREAWLDEQADIDERRAERD